MNSPAFGIHPFNGIILHTKGPACFSNQMSEEGRTTTASLLNVLCKEVVDQGADVNESFWDIACIQFLNQKTAIDIAIAEMSKPDFELTPAGPIWFREHIFLKLSTSWSYK